MIVGRSELPGLPSGPVSRWLEQVLPRAEGSPDWSAELVSGGLSNVTYRIRWGGDRLVLRRPPLGPVLPGAHDMQRECRVMCALAPTSVPVPAIVAFCADTDVLGVPFYAMREVPGTVVRSSVDAAPLAEGDRRLVSEQLVDVLADLHAIDPAEQGLGDLGRTDGYVARQLGTWGRQWERSRTRDLPDMERLFEALTVAVPADGPAATVVHGDYRLDNTILDGEDGWRIAAVLDWELATLGDPIADLATLLTYWHDAGDDERGLISVASGVTTAPGFLDTAALAERYAKRTGVDLSALDYYLALAAMKLGVILEGVHARHLGGKAVGDGYAGAGSAVPVLAARGLRLLRDRV